MNKNFTRIWKIPALLAVLTMFGLLAALLGTGAWHVLAWVALAIPAIVFTRFIIKPNKK